MEDVHGSPKINFTSVVPIQDYVLVRPIVKTVTDGGIALPDSAVQDERAVVVAVGPGEVNHNGEYVPVEVKEGDGVIFHRSQLAPPLALDIKGVEHYIIKHSHIVAVTDC